MPLGYFLNDGFTSAEQAYLLETCLSLMHQKNAKIFSVTFDGAQSNIGTIKKFQGSDVATGDGNFNPLFLNPATQDEMLAIIDPSNCLKLIRNTLLDNKVLYFKSEKIEWRFLELIVSIENKIGLKFANKLSEKHIHCQNSKMNVLLAAQTLSKSVSDTLIYLDEVRH